MVSDMSDRETRLRIEMNRPQAPDDFEALKARETLDVSRTAVASALGASRSQGRRQLSTNSPDSGVLRGHQAPE
jgi:hypothetical protein